MGIRHLKGVLFKGEVGVHAKNGDQRFSERPPVSQHATPAAPVAPVAAPAAAPAAICLGGAPHGADERGRRLQRGEEHARVLLALERVNERREEPLRERCQREDGALPRGLHNAAGAAGAAAGAAAAAAAAAAGASAVAAGVPARLVQKVHEKPEELPTHTLRAPRPVHRHRPTRAARPAAERAAGARAGRAEEGHGDRLGAWRRRLPSRRRCREEGARRVVAQESARGAEAGEERGAVAEALAEEGEEGGGHLRCVWHTVARGRGLAQRVSEALVETRRENKETGASKAERQDA